MALEILEDLKNSDDLSKDFKYQKKKDSSKSKSSEKSDHKHNYKKCLIARRGYMYNDLDHLDPYYYCIECGKIKHYDERIVIKDVDTGLNRLYTQLELLNEFSGHPIFRLNSYRGTYINIENDKMLPKDLRLDLY